ncbi:NUDIX domain-containing protein [Klebsiella pneumoniae subsp. pneumoniae]|nr:NUDIX domain-containing protein [Klebsiella pneumoniae subsp. pneumoniae]
MLVTRRSLGKKALARGMDQLGLRTPQQGETFEQAVTRRCRFELGVEISDIAPVHPAFRYRAVAPNGIVENEVCPVYAARVVSEVQPNDDEVMDYQWVDLATMLSALARHAVGVQPVDGAGSGKSGRPPGADRLCCASARVS